MGSLLSKLNIEEIRKLYCDEKLTQKQIAIKFETSADIICRFMKRYGIKSRSNYDAQISTIYLNDFQIYKIWVLYNSGINREMIAEKLEVSPWAVRKIIEGNCRGASETLKLIHINNTIPITYIQEQLILGSLLGDASIVFRRDNYDFQVGHCLEQKGYIEHKSNILGTNVHSYIKKEGSFSAGKIFYTLNYHNKYELEKIYKICTVDSRKTVNDLWVQKLEAPAIAYWFMDDGCSYFRKRDGSVGVEIATYSFSLNEIELLRNKLLHFNVETTINQHSVIYNHKKHTYPRLRIRSKSINNLMNIIEPIASNIDCMKYKIKRKLKCL